MAIPITMVIAGLVFVAFPVIYFDQIDGTTAIVLGFGVALIVWAAFRAISLRRNRPRPFD